MRFRYLAITTLLAGASAAQAQVFTDNFNADLCGLNKTSFVGGWTVGNGSVDVIGGCASGTEPGAGPGQQGNATGYSFGFGASNGNFIDLDGSSVDSGVFNKALTLTGGTTYVASFQLAGSQRGSTESVNVTFGTTSGSYTYASATGFTTSTLTFTPATTGSYALAFAEPGVSNNVGLLLDNVSVVAVPEPSTYGMLLAGIGAVGFVVRRRAKR